MAEGRLGCGGVVSPPSPSRASSCPSTSATTATRTVQKRVDCQRGHARMKKPNRKSCFRALVQAPHPCPAGSWPQTCSVDIQTFGKADLAHLAILPAPCLPHQSCFRSFSRRQVGATFLPFGSQHLRAADLASISSGYEKRAIASSSYLCPPPCTGWRAGRSGQLPLVGFDFCCPDRCGSIARRLLASSDSPI